MLKFDGEKKSMDVWLPDYTGGRSHLGIIVVEKGMVAFKPSSTRELNFDQLREIIIRMEKETEQL